MAKVKKVKAVEPEQDDSYLSYLGIGGDEEGEEEGEARAEGPQVADLLKTIESLTSRVDDLQTRPAYPMPAAVVPTVAPVAPQLADVTLDGLPDQMEDPTGYAKGLNARISAAVNENMRALSAYNADTQAQAAQLAGRSDQLWNDFQGQYLDKLEEGLPDGIDATAYIKVAAADVATRAQRRGANVDAYMYQTSEAFMADVYKEADKVLAPLREQAEEGEGEATGGSDPSVGGTDFGEAHRTSGIVSPSGVKAPKAPELENDGSMIKDLQEVQLRSGFY